MRTMLATFGTETIRPLRSAVGAVSAMLFVLTVLGQGLLVIAMQRARDAGAKSPVDLAHALRAQLSQVLPPEVADAVAALDPFVWSTVVSAATLLPLFIVVLGRDCLAPSPGAGSRSGRTAVWVARRAAALFVFGVVLTAITALAVVAAGSALLPASAGAEPARDVARIVGIAALAALPAIGIAVLAHAGLGRAWATPLVGLATLWVLGWLDLRFDSKLAHTLIPSSYDIGQLMAGGRATLSVAAVHGLWGVLLCTLAVACIDLRERRARGARPPRSARHPVATPAALSASPEVQE